MKPASGLLAEYIENTAGASRRALASLGPREVKRRLARPSRQTAIGGWCIDTLQSGLPHRPAGRESPLAAVRALEPSKKMERKLLSSASSPTGPSPYWDQTCLTPTLAKERLAPHKQTRATEPAVPVYRYFLFGGVERFRLSAGMVCGLAALAGAGVPLAAHLRDQTAPNTLAAAAIIISTLTAALVARWLGRRAAMVAGAIVIASYSAGVYDAGGSETLGVAAAVAAIVVFAFAELPSRVPATGREWLPAGFYLCLVLAGLLAGSGGLAVAAAVSLCALLPCQRFCGLRFFANRRGLATAAGGIALWAACVGWSDRWTFSQWCGPLGESPADWIASIRQADPAAIALACLVILAAMLVAGLVRAGHVAGPYGSLMASWLGVPLLLAACGAIGRSLAVAVAVPALSAAAVPGVVETVRRTRLFLRRRGLTAKLGIVPTRSILCEESKERLREARS